MSEHEHEPAAPDEVRRLMSLPPLPQDYEDWSMPVDEGILKALPKQGARLGYHVLGATVKVVRDRITEEFPDSAPPTAGVLAQRITRWLRPKGMVVEVRVHGSGGSKGYQLTERGQAYLDWLRSQGGN